MSFKINEEFKKKFTERKERQELQKLKNKYEIEGEDLSDSDSESEDEKAEMISNQLEKDFFKTLNALKKKNPEIYDPNVNFFGDYETDKKPSKKKTKSLKVRNYEGAHILQIESEQMNDEEEEEKPLRFEEDIIPKNNQEKELANCFLDILKKGKKDGPDAAIVREVEPNEKSAKASKNTPGIKKESDDDDDGDEEDDEKMEVNDDDDDDGESVDSKEKFLVDYFKKKKYLFESEEGNDDDDASNDEEELEKAELFEHKYNFRFEEPDDDFIKSYPRTIADSVRMTVNKRADKRKEVEARKKQEKAQKKEELRTLRKLKKKEEMKKLKKLKKISGAEMKLDDINLEEEFDASKHDDMMKRYFGKSYYDEYDDEDITQIDEKILESGDEYEDWDNWTGNQAEETGFQNDQQEIDGDEEQYQRSTKRSKKDKKESKKLRKSKFAEMMEKNRSKPLFDPTQETFDDYLDKHYNLDFEDVVDGQPCRFRYKKVVPADYGLTTDEILEAPDQELNAWVSLKKITECRTEEEEAFYEDIVKKKLKKKKKVLKSLYGQSETNKDSSENKKQGETSNQSNKNPMPAAPQNNKKRKRNEDEEPGISKDRLDAYNINERAFKYHYAPMAKKAKKMSKE